MKRKKLITLLCAALVLSLASTALALGLQNASDARELQRLTERLEESDGRIPDDFTREDMDKFLSMADNETAARVLKKISENAHALPMTTVDGSKYTCPPSNTPLINYQYDPEAEEKAVPDEAVTSDEIQKLIERLDAADGHIPNDFTQEDMDKFLKYADPEVVARIFKKISENAHAVDMPIVDDGEYIPPPSNTPLTYYQYNYETGEESFHTYEPSVK